MRVVLVNPAHTGIRPEDEEEHLGLGYLAAVARRTGHEAVIVDGTAHRLSPERLAALVGHRFGDAGLIGVSVIFQELIPAAMSIVSALRRGGFGGHISVGGHPPTFLYRELVRDFQGLDSVVVGEGEETFVDLLQALESGLDWAGLPGLVAARPASGAPGPEVSATADPADPGPPLPPTPRPLVGNLDDLPFPARDTFEVYAARSPGPRRASILRSRGCYGNCSFCDTRAFYAASPGAAWRVRSAANVADEVEMLLRNHAVECVRFWDDNFMGPGQRGREAAEELARELVRRGLRIPFSFECRVTDVDPDLFRLLKEAGLNRVFLGVEAANDRQLATYNKMVTVEDNRRALRVLEDLGIEVTVGMIMFDPDTTMEELNANLEFLKAVFGSWAGVKKRVARPWNRLEVYAGTPIEATLREQGRLRGTYVRYEYEFSDPTVRRLYGSGSLLRRLGLPIRDALSRLRRRA